MASTPQEPGVRERSRLRRRAAIEEAALSLMLERGYDAVTVEEICAAAEVSRRTFFNYYGSKEAVVIGRGPGTVPVQAQEEFLRGSGEGILIDLARMLPAVLVEGPHRDGPALHRARRRVIQQEPALSDAVAAVLAARGQDLEALVTRRIRRHQLPPEVPRDAAGDPEPGAFPAEVETGIRHHAALVVALWWGMVRHAVHTAAEEPGISDEDLVARSLDTLTLIKESAL